MQGPAGITIRRRIEWMDTDAAGIYHWTTVCRLAEAAEAALHRELGIIQATFGVTPRLSVQFDFHDRLRFDDLVAVQLGVERVGRSSIIYEIVVSGDRGVAATGRLVTCIIDPTTGRSTPVPENIRRLLTEAGPRTEPS